MNSLSKYAHHNNVVIRFNLYEEPILSLASCCVDGCSGNGCREASVGSDEMSIREGRGVRFYNEVVYFCEECLFKLYLAERRGFQHIVRHFARGYEVLCLYKQNIKSARS